MLGESGEGGNSLPATVDQDSVGGGHSKVRGEVVKSTETPLRTEGIDFGCVIFHCLEQGSHLVRVRDSALDQVQLALYCGGHLKGPGVQPG